MLKLKYGIGYISLLSLKEQNTICLPGNLQYVDFVRAN
ncbi:hypothetical protein Ccrd_025970 [Cynara cardunculus var. scolymus]|uniref:Uncharacterized protein n=1 Tax=Cynara cardunculus var. scolymus TaxID=59895 RepID=A0A103T5Q5_CYNCS|nr:hypothetical protein Ccrd_025970 [Cynara cardunculus var. scolymus]